MRLFSYPIAFRPSVPLATRSDLPRKPGVYYAVQWFKPWRPLYIGMSGNIHKRWNVEGDRRHHKLHELSKYSGVRLYYRTTRTRDSAVGLEAVEIDRYNPPLNGRKESLRFGFLHALGDWAIDSIVLGAIGFVVLKFFGF